MREVVLDTETTGLSPDDGNRIIEIGCVELWNRAPTGLTYHEYVNPGRDIPLEITQITGLTSDFLEKFTAFDTIVDSFLDFIGDSPLVIHNAKFDINFLNSELHMVGKPLLDINRAIDTLLIARKKFPGQPASLDALSRRFNVNIPRERHGALLDSQILAEVYIELNGGRQRILNLSEAAIGQPNEDASTPAAQNKGTHGFPRRAFPVPAADLLVFDQMLGKIKNPAWTKD
ncbi:MAG: DNA polymerase III subunit epsilon [Holosporales bacterium]|jgi:DNA polymerase-3 subunit epsilon|nr:DNA polymerase III subunit epsilon [Holosporales bacterium]